jgi:BirA family transcriptional regulator, biotin operon repressor / biotin---[acetyl-CoA-carboxylase] ligase
MSNVIPDTPPKTSNIAGWLLQEHRVVSSTNLLAAALPAWNAIRADTQTTGRGRFQRSWISDEGGLWLSAVVPGDSTTPAGRALPLVAGLAVFDALGSIGVKHLRMRWPNDLLVDNRKLAGLLVDQFQPGSAVIGIGINVTNRPEVLDRTLTDQTTRLADLITPLPTLQQLTALILQNIRQVIGELEANGFASLLPRLSALWGSPRRVELDLGNRKSAGIFNGIDEQGRLILLDDSGQTASYSSHLVIHLKELP